LLLLTIFLNGIVQAQTSTCFCIGPVLDCSTPGNFNFTTTEADDVFIATDF